MSPRSPSRGEVMPRREDGEVVVVGEEEDDEKFMVMLDTGERVSIRDCATKGKEAWR